MNFALLLSCIAAIETGCPLEHDIGTWSKYDCKVGKHGETTRYQILPSVAKAVIGKNPKTSLEAYNLAWYILLARYKIYNKKWNSTHLPTTQIVYALWNSPAYTIRTGKIPEHCKEKAIHFDNLYEQELLEQN